MNHALKGKQPIGGMKRPKWDPRHFSWKKKFGAVSGLPTGDFDAWVPLVTRDQGLNDLCTDYGSVGAAEATFKVPLSVAFQRAAHNRIAGTPGYIGIADPVDAANAVRKIGALAEQDAPFSEQSDPPAKFADLASYPSFCLQEAGTMKEVSLYDCDSESDLFDSIRAAMVMGQQMNFATVVMVGAEWRSSWMSAPKGIITTNDPKEPSSDHEFVITGQKNIDGVLYLKAHLSSGTAVGDGGFFYFPREIANKFIFAKAFGPGNPNDYKTQLWNVFQKLYDIFYSFLRPAPKNGGVPALTLAQAKDWARGICGQAGLDAANTEILIACVMVESGFNRYAINFNKDVNGNVTSIDYGICQINDYFHIGAGKDFPDPEYVLSNPEECIRWMAKQFAAGKQSLWSSFVNGSYKKCL